ncbi:MAG: hypothetical protein FJ125_01030, partial [Deltaproteobacteria bacterium]|nr:hypothetical protein [Deltaproteobacteria bacterium]
MHPQRIVPRLRTLAAVAIAALLACQAPLALAAPAQAAQAGGGAMFIDDARMLEVTGKLLAQHGPGEKARIERGVRQVARLWTARDGSPEEFAAFCAAQFATGQVLDDLFVRFQENLEQISGHFNALTLQIRRHMDEDTGPLQPVDKLFAEFGPDAHLVDDLFATKLAFIVLLNFPLTSLQEKLAQGARWSRRQWAESRLSGRFQVRVPAEVNQKVTAAYAAADNYIYEYNIHMDRVVDAKGRPMFREGLALISHWGLRDELKALYVDPRANLERQEVIHTIMERIIAQQIPAAVINNPAHAWEPRGNTVDGKPAEREPDTRFVRLLEVFGAHRLEDPHYPDQPSHIARRFELSREIPEEQFVALLASVLDAPVGKGVARLIEQRLDRKLRPFDIWYDGFKVRGSIPEEKLDRVVQERYPNLEAFQQGIPDILQKLGFDERTATFLGERIEVDPARGAGHAWGPQMRTEKAHLRTKVPAGG